MENVVMDSSQFTDFIYRHQRTLVEFNFEGVNLCQGNWEDTFAPVRKISGNYSKSQEFMDAPLMLSSTVDKEPIVIGPLMGPLPEDAVEELSSSVRRRLPSVRQCSKSRRGRDYINFLRRYMPCPNQTRHRNKTKDNYWL